MGAASSIMADALRFRQILHRRHGLHVSMMRRNKFSRCRSNSKLLVVSSFVLHFCLHMYCISYVLLISRPQPNSNSDENCYLDFADEHILKQVLAV